ncbi:anti sigma factor C-terminal domain-containing protein [Maledivibacter halophilus]|uniref:Sigma factor regulator N-terminal n=1 Tax=Maledivibacter halophilus TaxID=36842 RepID=A0A1T5MJ62_9FIRM|nr:anti sigma factor C-terminal domain-containing protein [Maledivibacter halophilus]SKC88245.1 Sigma factor regulator N-terminal [Maledivibacter halophilus]
MRDKKNNNIDNEEREFNDMFTDLKENKLKKTVRKAKWKSIFRTTIISMIVVIILGVSANLIARNITQRQRGDIQIARDRFFEIARPNKYIGKRKIYDGSSFGGKTIYTTYKLINGKVVFTGEESYTYGPRYGLHTDIMGTSSPMILAQAWDEEDAKEVRYNELGQRRMVFYYPYISYRYYRNDLSLLEDIDQDKYVEIALSFDKAYGFDEMENILPKDVITTWYWIDDLNDEEKEEKKEEERIRTNENEEEETYINPAKVCSEARAYGIKLFDRDGDKIQDPIDRFVSSLERGLDDDTFYKDEFTRVFENIAGEDKEIQRKDIKIQGAVVTGTAEELKKLRNLPFIRASTLGIVTDKY